MHLTPSKHSEMWICFTANAMQVCVLPDAKPTQMMPSKRRAATREAMSPFLRRSELGLAASESFFRSVKVLLWGGELQVYLCSRTRESESVIRAHWLEMLAAGSHVPGQLPLHSSALFCYLAKIFLCVHWDASLRQSFIRSWKYFACFTQTIHVKSSPFSFI